MRKKTKSLLQTIYDFDSERNAYIIRILIGQYTHVFNDLDPAPMKRRDLNQEILTYLEDCSKEIPLKYKVQLEFVVKDHREDSDKEQRARVGLKTYFSFVMLNLRREIVGAYKKCAVYILTSCLLLSVSFYLRSRLADFSIPFSILKEGLSIGGWVFLWEAIAIVVFSNREVFKEFKKYERLNDAEVKFTYLAD